MLRADLLCLALAALFACRSSSSIEPGTVFFESSDAVKIAATWTPPVAGAPVFLLMHGLGAGRGEWAKFTVAASSRGAGVLAFDARGHGESGGGRYQDFQRAEDWAKVLNDFDAAFRWLEARGVAESRVILGGASLGANLAANAALGRKPASLLLLSPGWEYAGIPLQPALDDFQSPVVAAAAPSDFYSFASCEKVQENGPKPNFLFLKGASGHGVGLFDGPAGVEFLERLLTESLRSLGPESR